MAGGGDCVAIGVLDGEELSPRVIFIGCDQPGIFVSARCDLPLVERFNVALCVPAIVVVCAADADANGRAAFIVTENVNLVCIIRGACPAGINALRNQSAVLPIILRIAAIRSFPSTYLDRRKQKVQPKMRKFIHFLKCDHNSLSSLYNVSKDEKRTEFLNSFQNKKMHAVCRKLCIPHATYVYTYTHSLRRKPCSVSALATLRLARVMRIRTLSGWMPSAFAISASDHWRRYFSSRISRSSAGSAWKSSCRRTLHCSRRSFSSGKKPSTEESCSSRTSKFTV